MFSPVQSLQIYLSLKQELMCLVHMISNKNHMKYVMFSPVQSLQIYLSLELELMCLVHMISNKNPMNMYCLVPYRVSRYILVWN